MISALVFTLNEEVHLPRCLASLRWCDDVIVVDSLSTDRSEAICREAGVRFVPHRFTSMWEQRNWALEHGGARHTWALILDADERVPPELAEELQAVAQTAPLDMGAYMLRRRFHFWGRWLRHSSLYPTWLVRLVRRDRVRFYGQGHGEGQNVQGAIGRLAHDLIDENLLGIDEWFARQNRYSTRDAAYELELESRPLQLAALAGSDPLARRTALKAIATRLPCRAAAYFLYTYFFRMGFLDGRDGLAFCLMRAMYQQMVAVKKYDQRRSKRAA